NMAPEYGATMGFFPVDAKTLAYLRFTGRDQKTVELVEAYCTANGLFWTPESTDPEFTDVLHLDVGTVQPSLAGPKRPQDRVILQQMKPQWQKELVDSFGKPVPSETVSADRWASEGGESAKGGGIRPVNPPDVNDTPKASIQQDKGAVVTMNGRTFRLEH